MRTFSFAFSILFAALVAFVDAAQAQFLSRDFRHLWANEVFENYGAAGYRDYDLEEENRRFDLFGDLLIDGVDIIQYSETRRDAPGIRGSYEARNSRYERFFQKLIIASEGFGDWSSRLIVGDHIRTFFTPMTLNLPSYNGIRWDGSSRKSRFSVLATHLTEPVLASGLSLNQDATQRRIFGTSLFGAHWESQIGGILKFGTTYVNVHRFDAEASAKVNSLKGAVPRIMQGGLKKVFVFFTDDAPHDNVSGAEVHQLEMLVDGVLVPPERVGRIDNLLTHIPVTTDVSSTILLQPHEVDYLRRNRAWLRSVVDASNTPFFKSLLDGITQPAAPASASAPLQANGTDVVYYEFALPDTVTEVNFNAVLANDYSVDVVGAVQVPLLASGEDDFYYDWYNALRAGGRRGQRANLRQVSFSYGFPTGLTVAGFDFDAEVFGFQLKGEFARSITFLQMPTAKGKRQEDKSSTFYFNLLRPVNDRAEVGFEYFDVPARYTTDFSTFQLANIGPTVGGRLYEPFALVEDNDDLDDWADRDEHNDPLAPFRTSAGQGHGVFPGLDPNNDGVLDFNIDLDRGTDALQPFLSYYVELPGLVYGDDFDNNGAVDFRENDNLPDYLYPVDHRGFHGFTALEPSQRTKARLGWYKVSQPKQGTENDTRYAEGEYRRDWKGLSYVRLNHRIKWMKDDIQNTVFAFGSTGTLAPDRLQNRDSVSNTTYFEWGLTPMPALNMRNIISYSHVHLDGELLDDPLLAQPGTANGFAMMNKFDYTWKRGRFTVLPQFKHIYARSKSPENNIPDSQNRWIMPILRADYSITPRTALKAGVQGIPVIWAETFRDVANPANGFERQTYTMFLQNKSNYRGYDVTMLLGTYRTTVKYVDSLRPRSGVLEYFFRVYIG